MKKIVIALSFIFVSNCLFAQGHMVYGVVHSFDEIPLIGAEIQVKSTKKSVFTDSVGNFAVYCYSDDKLKIMARGFNTQSVKISMNTKIVAVNLKLKNGERNREYAIGYGYVSEQDKTTAVTGVNTNNARFLKYSDIIALIRDQVAGVQIKNGEIIIRGDRSFQGSSAALIVVDDVIWDYESLRTLSPIQVKRIDAIKDGSAAVYGSRGANGVIIIETIKGGDEIK